MILVYVAIVFFALVVLGLIARMFGFSIMRLIRIFKDDLVLAYSTASSETVLPRIIEKMEAYGAPKAISSFVVPTGYSFNLDGSTLYQSIAAIFIAQLYGIDLSIGQQIMLVLTLMVTSRVSPACRAYPSWCCSPPWAASASRSRAWPSSPAWTASWTWRAPPST